MSARRKRVSRKVCTVEWTGADGKRYRDKAPSDVAKMFVEAVRRTGRKARIVRCRRR